MGKSTFNRTISLVVVLAIVALKTTSASAATDPVSYWNTIAIQAIIKAGQGPVPASRSLAIVQIAIHDALNTIDTRYERYAFGGAAPNGASANAAIATATEDALIGAIGVGPLPFPGFGSPALQTAALKDLHDNYVTPFLAGIPDGLSKADGVAIGHAAAQAIVTLRSKDHATDFVSYTPGTRPGDWRPTPNPVPFDRPAPADLLPAALPGWGNVTPFVLRRSTLFEPAGPPRLSGPTYARDYDEVKSVGAKNSTTRTVDQTSIARFWYEPSAFGWNRVARQVAADRGLDSWETARLLALVNVAMADGYIGGYEAKYEFNIWRPVTAIRAGDTDGNDRTVADPAWSSYLNTPALPDYTSTHSVAGGAASAILQRFFRTDNVGFTIPSAPPFAQELPRSYTSFSQAAAENGESRI